MSLVRFQWAPQEVLMTSFRLVFLLKYCVYILYSKEIDTFYIGETTDLPSRILLHNNGDFKGAFTQMADDWQEFAVFYCSSREIARKIEHHIKRMKSRKYLFDLKQYPEIFQKLVIKYS